MLNLSFLVDEIEYLASILKEFDSPIKKIWSWRNQGQILVDYITLTEKVGR